MAPMCYFASSLSLPS